MHIHSCWPLRDICIVTCISPCLVRFHGASSASRQGSNTQHHVALHVAFASYLTYAAWAALAQRRALATRWERRWGIQSSMALDQQQGVARKVRCQQEDVPIVDWRCCGSAPWWRPRVLRDRSRLLRCVCSYNEKKGEGGLTKQREVAKERGIYRERERERERWPIIERPVFAIVRIRIRFHLALKTTWNSKCYFSRKFGYYGYSCRS